MKKAKDDWAWIEVNFADWREAVDRRMLDVYAITIDDSGFEDDDLRSHWEDKESPFEFVLWFGNKYDLDPKEAFGLALKQNNTPSSSSIESKWPTKIDSD